MGGKYLKYRWSLCPVVLGERFRTSVLTCVLSSRIQEPWSVCPHTSLWASEEEEIHGSDWRLFRPLWRHPLDPLTTLVKWKKKKTLGKQKVLKFYFSFLSTTVLELSWVEHYDPRCTYLNSSQPPVVLKSTQSNQVGSWYFQIGR
jgi:hypothetical protein